MRVLALTLLAGCRVELGPPGPPNHRRPDQGPDARPAAEQGPSEVWVYTSMYEHVIDAMKPALAAALPDVRVEWVQAGSEKIAQRWEAEADAGGARACVLATSDPGWFADLAERDLLRPYVSPRAVTLPRAWTHPTHQAFRISLMVLAGRAAADGSVDAPRTFAALADPVWKGRFSTADPLSSGTMFTTLATLDAVEGRDVLTRMRANGWVAAGGSSAVLARIQTGEKPVGALLLENLLAQDGYPAQGPVPEGLAAPAPGTQAVAIPGYAAIPRACGAPEAAEQVVDWLFGPEGQAEIVRARMHSPFPDAPTPAGAQPLAAYPLLSSDTPIDAAALRAFWAEGR